MMPAPSTIALLMLVNNLACFCLGAITALIFKR